MVEPLEEIIRRAQLVPEPSPKRWGRYRPTLGTGQRRQLEEVVHGAERRLAELGLPPDTHRLLHFTSDGFALATDGAAAALSVEPSEIWSNAALDRDGKVFGACTPRARRGRLPERGHLVKKDEALLLAELAALARSLLDAEPEAAATLWAMYRERERRLDTARGFRKRGASGGRKGKPKSAVRALLVEVSSRVPEADWSFVHSFLLGGAPLGESLVHELVEELELPITPYDSYGRPASPFTELDGRLCFQILRQPGVKTCAIQSLRQFWSELRRSARAPTT